VKKERGRDGLYLNLFFSHFTFHVFPCPYSFTIQHSAAATGGAASAGEVLFDPGCLADIDHQTVIVTEFLADFDIAQGIKKDAVAILTGFQIWFAGMIDPFGGVADVLGVDDVAMLEQEVVTGLGVSLAGKGKGDH